MQEIIEKLNATWCDTKKAIGMATKVFDGAEVVEDPSKRLAEATQSLGAAFEVADTLSNELGWVVKYKKDFVSKVPLSLPYAQSLQKRCAGILQEILDCAKQARVLMLKEG